MSTIPNRTPADLSATGSPAEDGSLPVRRVELVSVDEEDGPSIDLMELVVRFLAEWKLGLLVAFLTFVVASIYIFRVPAQYEATATILPKQAFAESNSLTTLFSGKLPEDLYTGLLKSRSVTDNVIRELDLAPKSGSWAGVRGGLEGALKVLVGADGLLRISVRDENAQKAMRVANAYLDGLNQQQQTMGMSQSVLNRQFYEQQLAQEKQALAAAEADLEQMQKSSGVIQAGAQTATGLGQIAGTRSQITGLEVQLAALLASATEQNPQVVTLRSQIARLEQEERTMEAGGGTGAGAPISAGRMPQVNLDYQRKQREVTFHEGLLNALASQFQNAKLTEAQAADAFQVVDYAIVPEVKSYPPRTKWYMLAAAGGVFMGGFFIVLVLIKRRVQADADYRRHMQTIRQNFGFRR